MIARIGTLCHHAFEPLLLCRLEQGVAVLERLREPHDGAAPVDQRRQTLSALGERQPDERLAFELEQVEDLVDERLRALLHEREARPALLVERAYLAVEDAVGRLDRPWQHSHDRGEPLGEVVARA